MSLEMDPFSTTYKTEFCERTCSLGSRCVNAHDISELRRNPSEVIYDADLCDFRHNKEHNDRYSRCHHAHNSTERGWHPMRWHTERCTLGFKCTDRIHCPFAHTKQELDQGHKHRDIYSERLRKRHSTLSPTTSVDEKLHLINMNIEKVIEMLENKLSENP